MTDYCNMLLMKELNTLNNFLTGFFCWWWLDTFLLLFLIFLRYSVQIIETNKQPTKQLTSEPTKY